MTEIQGHHADGCLMCAVRSLTEGRAKEWMPDGSGAAFTDPIEITGVVLRQGTQPSHFSSTVPFVELWLGGTDRIRVTGHGTVLNSLLVGAEIQVGDTVTIRYTGKKEIQTGKWKGKEFKGYELEIRRGHA